MCGIYGWQWKPSSKPTAETRHLLATLLGSFNDERGGDSYGWYAPGSSSLTRGLGLIGGVSRHAARHDSLIGHTRKATVGEKTKENCHPFSIDNIVGAHNGSVYNHEPLNKLRVKANKKEFEVDSMHIFDSLSEDKDLDGLYGYGAIEWVDLRKAKGNIYLARLSETSDLGIARTVHGIVWSSSKVKLETTLWLCGLKAETWELEHETVHVVQRGEIYKTEKKLFFGQAKSQGTGAYGSRIHSGHQNYSDNYDRSFGKETASELDLMDAEAERIGKTIGKKKRWDNDNWCYKCCSWKKHENWCETLQSKDIPNPKKTAPSNPKQSDLLPGSTIVCVSCHNDIDHHSSDCVILRNRTDVGGGVGE